jgi:hypothetical protein
MTTSQDLKHLPGSAWTSDAAEVLAFGRVLADAGWLNDVEETFYYIENPWRWNGEHRLWNEQYERAEAGKSRLWDAFREEIKEP